MKIYFAAILFLLLPTKPFAVLLQPPNAVANNNETWQIIVTKMSQYYSSNSKAIQIINNELTAINIPYWGFDDNLHEGQLVCNKLVAKDLQNVFEQLFQLHFCIAQMKPIGYFNFSDSISMQANNTNCFDFRLQTHSKYKLSKHSHGLAVDINPIQNPYVKGKIIYPNNANTINKGKIDKHSELGKKVISIFKQIGWKWGGNFKHNKDYMHFEKG